MARTQFGTYNVIAAFPDLPAANRALEQLRTEGIKGDDVSLLGRQGEEVLGDTDTTNSGSIPATIKGAVAGAAGGGVLGGVAGFLIGLAFLAVPGVGPVVTAGVWAATGLGAVFGAQGGGFVGAISGAAMSKGRAEAYQVHLEQGRILVGVHTDDADQSRHAFEILGREQPLDIDQFGSGFGTVQ